MSTLTFLAVLCFLSLAGHGPVTVEGGILLPPPPGCPKGKNIGDSFTKYCQKCMCEPWGISCKGCGMSFMPGGIRVRDSSKEYPGCCPTYIRPAHVAAGKVPNICDIVVSKGWTGPGCEHCSCKKGKVVCTKCEKPESTDGLKEIPGTGREFPKCCPHYVPDCPKGRKKGDMWSGEGCTGCECSDHGVVCKGCGTMFMPGSIEVRNLSAAYPGCCPKYVTPQEIADGKVPNICEIKTNNFPWTSPKCELCSCQDGKTVCDPCVKPDDISNMDEVPGTGLEFPSCCPTYVAKPGCGNGRLVGDKWTEPHCTGCECVADMAYFCLPCPLMIYPPEVKMVQNMTLDYPQCCPHPAP